MTLDTVAVLVVFGCYVLALTAWGVGRFVRWAATRPVAGARRLGPDGPPDTGERYTNRR